jgi:hypothetical protein
LWYVLIEHQALLRSRLNDLFLTLHVDFEGEVAYKRQATALRSSQPGCAQIAWVLRSIDGYTDLDFELLLTVADWFTTNTAGGLTPRQVPIPGVHAKWLNTHGPAVEALTATPLRLAPRHPARIHFAYLDPNYLASGRRRFDSAAVGDTMHPAYKPDIVVITENKDTAIHFPQTPGGVAIEGCGYGAAVVAAFNWIVSAPTLVYWGDIDAAGFEILDCYRRDGVPAVSILKDIHWYSTYAPWGTFHHPNGEPIGTTDRKPLPNLTESERSAYHAVCDPVAGLPPRVEQERIPLQVAPCGTHRGSLPGQSLTTEPNHIAPGRLRFHAGADTRGDEPGSAGRTSPGASPKLPSKGTQQKLGELQYHHPPQPSGDATAAGPHKQFHATNPKRYWTSRCGIRSTPQVGRT